MKKYSEKAVRMLVLRLKEEYDTIVKRERLQKEALKEEIRTLRARLSVLEGERDNVSSALVHAVEEGENIKKQSALEGLEERRELLLLAEKCRLLSDRLLKKYPDEEDSNDFKLFTDALRRELGEETEEIEGFNMDDVLNPKQPLDLAKLCRGLGLMEDE